jgi:error-prone DNA polymerase
MGFYHPATLVSDADPPRRRGAPIDVTRSGWRCDVEDGGRALRLGLRYVSGLREETGRRIEAARAAAPWASLADFAARAQPNERELATLAEVGALRRWAGRAGRRCGRWTRSEIRRAVRGRRSTFCPPPASNGMSRRCQRLTLAEEMAADFRAGSISTGPHPITFVRAELDRRGVSAPPICAASRRPPRAIAGVVIVRQRPGTANGFVFVTLEDETGFANAIVTPRRFALHKHVIVANSALVIEGVLQNQEGVVSIKADRFHPLEGDAAAVDISHDFIDPGSGSPEQPDARGQNRQVSLGIAVAVGALVIRTMGADRARTRKETGWRGTATAKGAWQS